MSNVTFALPGDGRSGGVRVTVIMANILRSRGYRVRIACATEPTVHALRNRLFRLLRSNASETGFLHEFKGPVVRYRNLSDVSFSPDDVLIAVGSYMVEAVRELRTPVRKVRFNHGFPAKPDESLARAWVGPMPTITVSKTLVPRLQELTAGSVWGVVPNGVETRDYHVDAAVPRTGIGALYNRHPNKAPEDLVAVLREIHRRRPDIPQHVFSTESRPAGLEHVTYTQLPSVAAARTIYNKCKVWLLTSLTEGLPGVVLEAMACGCVVVSSDNDGSKEILTHDLDGLLVPKGRREAFVSAVEQLFNDSDLLNRLGQGSTRRVAAFTWDRAADQMERFLADLPRFERELATRTGESQTAAK